MIRGLNLTLCSFRAHPDHFHRIDVMRFVTANNINLGGGLARDSRWAGNELESSELACF